MFKKTLFAAAVFAFAGTAFGYQANGGRILDGAGNPIQLRGVSWFGAETSAHVVGGLWVTGWKAQIAAMKSAGVNAVRLPFCPATLRGTGTDWIHPALNPELNGLNSLQMFDKVVRELSNQGFYVLLDHHTPDCNTISELWYTPNYSEQQWLADLELAADLFSGIPGVIGIDLKNEPHGAATWGTGNQATDWNLAAERASARVLAKAPHWLIFVQGVDENPNCSEKWGHVWGGNLEPLKCKPLNIPKDRLVLSPHIYGFDVYAQADFFAYNFPDNMPAIWDRQFGRYIDEGYTVVIGEFGGKYGEGDKRDKTWQDAFVKYQVNKKMASSFYWGWNPNSSDVGGILKDDWTSIRYDKVNLLKTLWSGTAAAAASGTGASAASAASASFSVSAPAPAPAPASTPSPAPAPAPTAAMNSSNGYFKVDTTVTKDWGYGYCATVKITNTAWYQAWWNNLTIPVSGKVDNLWNADWTQSGSSVTARGLWWNVALYPWNSTEIGYCATR